MRQSTDVSVRNLVLMYDCCVSDAECIVITLTCDQQFPAATARPSVFTDCFDANQLCAVNDDETQLEQPLST